MEFVPAISIVIPVLNRAVMLREALQSVDVSDAAALEIVIVDGGSIDGTQTVAGADPRVRLIEARGTGIYEAIERGFREARGRWICILNSDDLYASGAWNTFMPIIAASDEADMVTGRAYVFRDGETHAHSNGGGAERAMTPRALTRGPIAINARFFSRSLLARTGGFDFSLRISADRDFMIRIALHRPRNVIVDLPLYLYRRHAGSCTLGDDRAALVAASREHLRIFSRHLASDTLPPGWRRDFELASLIEEMRIARLERKSVFPILGRRIAQEPGLTSALVASGVGAIARRLLARTSERLPVSRSRSLSA